MRSPPLRSFSAVLVIRRWTACFDMTPSPNGRANRSTRLAIAQRVTDRSVPDVHGADQATLARPHPNGRGWCLVHRVVTLALRTIGERRTPMNASRLIRHPI